MMYQGEDFRRRIYCCKWYAYGNLSIMKGILLVLTQKPMVLVACNFFSISLDMFLKVTIVFTILYVILDINYKINLR